MLTGLAAVQDVLAQPRIALAGVSRSERDFSRYIFRELVKRGIDVVPVNPNASEIEGRKCFGSVAVVEPPVTAAIVMTSSDAAPRVVEECGAAKIPRVWLGRGINSPEAVRYCEEHGITYVNGECPMMFLPGGEWFHGLHRFVKDCCRILSKVERVKFS